MVKRIVLEDGVWIGAKSVVCPGVVARTHAILTAGSTISKDMQAYSYTEEILQKKSNLEILGVKVSIITVCYNAEKYIKDTIESVLEQDYPDMNT